MKDLKTMINEIIDGKSEETVKQIFEDCLKTYNKPKPTFMYSVDGIDGGKFEAENKESALYKILESCGICVWEVET